MMAADAWCATSRRQAFREIYQELVEINMTNSVGDSLKTFAE
jgi:hypothetical protein